MKTILAAIVLTISIASAQQPPPPPGDFQPCPPGPGQRPPGGDFMREFFPPELVMRNQRAIGLTPSQQSAIREEMVRAMPRFTELQWQISAEEETLSNLVKTGSAGEKEIVAQFDKLLAVEAQIKRLQLENLLKVRSILTPDQQESLKALKRLNRPSDPNRPGPPREP
jgi:Spy/CpxP family protein refolding chaperone